jgi:hypothetical protein
MSKLYVYGDSWPWGAGLDDPCTQSFPALLGKYLNLQIDNRSVQSTSIEHLLYYFLNDCRNNNFGENDKVLFCLTGKSRSMYFDHDDTPQELHPRGIKETDKLYYKYFYSKKLADYNFEKNVLLCKLICDSKKLRSYFVCNWEHNQVDLHSDCNFYPLSLLGILHPERNLLIEEGLDVGALWNASPYLYDHNHPNILGHQKIAEELAKWIN